MVMVLRLPRRLRLIFLVPSSEGEEVENLNLKVLYGHLSSALFETLTSKLSLGQSLLGSGNEVPQPLANHYFALCEYYIVNVEMTGRMNHHGDLYSHELTRKVGLRERSSSLPS
ncbi:hypothetical protein DFJ43DRAFT_1042230 [Lentinula guzmanii]|uniref:Uncharacterized protein n=1 Tax=Lentinula guzmanii TaxID=2804957 RepID=A0AA38JA81_9AGAR|nr:hypothetical protein DFJ43DRAFT_1042230 [Lentinula guzmanii]